MKPYLLSLIVLFLLSCQDDQKLDRTLSKVDIKPIFEDSTLSVRAIDFDKDYLYYGSADHIGKRAFKKKGLRVVGIKMGAGSIDFKHVITHENEPLHFRAIASTAENYFAISIANPAKLYKISKDENKPELVYTEENEKVFYDSIDFWNDKEGIAMGDPTDGCISIIITRDGGDTWQKVSCDKLPKAEEGEAAFAASDTNIKIVGDKTWIATGGKASRVLFSSDKGNTWKVYDTPIVQGKETTGMYSMDFYDEKNGYAIGGDYTKAADSTANKIRTDDGGKTWQLVAENQSPGYRSCVQYIPERGGKELIAVGFKGIDYSNDYGDTWKHLSDEGFYTVRFLNDSIAYAAGRGRISKLTFRE
ncbi:oxidoreductase [Winogradskyella sp. 3972H.M.0a.05]|uniref:WD40/YVTN/BNR-like repeat-containing protein n=1 Tax=Winogradskyella sp. 3972H.M.0a.05 TaxID=2950277 RepID=UPI00339ABB54